MRYGALSAKMASGVRRLFDSNLKVHFAGSDGQKNFHVALKAAQTNYRLYSCYKYILKKQPDADFRLPENHVIRQEVQGNRHVIQDSGLFTLMFGADKGKPQNRETLTMWQDKLIAFVQQNRLNATCVEIDCQKILGVEEAWYFRERMRRLLKNRQINVFHFEDGREGLDKLIEFSDYLAISVPEMRIVKPKTFRQDVRYLTHYIKDRKPEIDIHLLGCTDMAMIEQNSFCTSADSTSWLAGVKYGYIDDGFRTSHINYFRKEIFEERLKEVRRIAAEVGVQMSDRSFAHSTNASICATICKKKYERAAGPQN